MICSLKLNMPEIMKAVPPHTFKTGERQNCTCLDDAIYNLPQDKYDLIVGASVAKHCHQCYIFGLLLCLLGGDIVAPKPCLCGY